MASLRFEMAAPLQMGPLARHGGVHPIMVTTKDIAAPLRIRPSIPNRIAIQNKTSLKEI